MNTEQDIAQALQDIQVSPEQSGQISDAVRSGQKEKAMRLILSARSDILSELHGSQERLYRLDHIIRSLKE